IKTLHGALGLNPTSRPIKIDLASAYFERAQTAARVEDLGTAAELLSQVLNEDPNDPIALFNRAIVYQKLFLYEQAIQDWEHYLRIDPQGDWSSEAKSRLDALR